VPKLSYRLQQLLAGTPGAFPLQTKGSNRYASLLCFASRPMDHPGFERGGENFKVIVFCARMSHSLAPKIRKNIVHSLFPLTRGGAEVYC
jgi:hypothetical protein